MRGKSSERKSGCIRRGGASNTPNADVQRLAQERPPPGRLFCLRFEFQPGETSGAMRDSMEPCWETGSSEAVMLKVGVVGGAGYTGIEVLCVLALRPRSRPVAVTYGQE